MLRVDRLSKRYGDKQILSEASFSVGANEIVSIVGSSGEGKSTIARILCGTVKPDSGLVSFHGRDLTYDKRDKALRRKIQLIPQQPFSSLDPRQQIGDAIAEPLLYYKLAASRAEARQRVNELLERMLLPPELYSRRPGELSGGQAQRVLIARSLTLSPSLLIADEATSMLDVSSQAQIVRLFRQLVQEGGISILMISHDRMLVNSVSQRVYRLSEGRLEHTENKTEEDEI